MRCEGDWPLSSLLGLGLARDRLLLEADSLGSSWGTNRQITGSCLTCRVSRLAVFLSNYHKQEKYRKEEQVE